MHKANFYIPKNRYLELKYFCRQYPYWQMVLSNPEKYTSETLKEECKAAMFLVERAAYSLNPEKFDFPALLLHKVTRGGNLQQLKEYYHCEDTTDEKINEAYKQFFYFLSKSKGIILAKNADSIME